jgi:TRAP-type C4-dicarboxylate transport system substrate-binding protein
MREELHYIESYGAGADNNDLLAVLDDPSFSSLISGVYEDGGYHLLGIADQGFRVMSTNKAVRSMVDFKGQKIRTMENPYHLAFWKSIGANPTPMSFSEVYIGLQQHTIDAQENPYDSILGSNLQEVQKYIIDTRHVMFYTAFMMNKGFYEARTDNMKAIIDKAANAEIFPIERKMPDDMKEKLENYFRYGKKVEKK